MTRRRPELSEAGFSLPELVLAVAIIGIAFLTIMGGVFTAVVGSDIHRKQATGETVLRSFAEAVKATEYVNCATPAAYEVVYTAPEGYSAEVAGRQPADPRVEYWDAGTGEFVDSASCPSPEADAGLQRLSLKVTSTDRRAVVESLQVLKRRGATA